MVYNQANQILGCALTPNNRGICKKTAIFWHADPAPLVDFADNRLLPVTTGYVKLQEFTIRFLDYNGSVLQTRSIPYGTVPTYTGSATPSRTGWHWNGGWTPTIVAATAAADYTATFDINQYTVTFVVDGSQYGNTQTVNHGGHATEPSAPTKTGYTFTGWSPSVASTAITGNTTFTAQFSRNQYRVTYQYVKDGSTGSLGYEDVYYGSTPSSVPTPQSYTNYSGSWNTNPASATITGNTTFTYTYVQTGPSTAGYFSIQGGYNSIGPWIVNDCHMIPRTFSLEHTTNNTTSRTGRMNVTGYKYNMKTGTVTQLPSGCYIDFAHVVYTGNAATDSSTYISFTLCDALYDEGWRLSRGEANETGDAGSSGGWHGSTSDKTKYYTQRDRTAIAQIGCPYGTPEEIWFFNISTSDATVTGNYLNGSYVCTDNMVDASKSYATNKSGSDSNMQDSYVAVMIS